MNSFAIWLSLYRTTLLHNLLSVQMTVLGTYLAPYYIIQQIGDHVGFRFAAEYSSAGVGIR